MKRKNLLVVAVLLACSWTLAGQCVTGDCINGSGVMIYRSGARYIGEFVQGTRQGLGTCYYTDGSKYYGMWESDRPEGNGLQTDATGKVVQGIWRRGRLLREDPTAVPNPEGRAMRIHSGCISGNCITGNGIFIYPNGDIYSGDYSNGRRNGAGVCYYFNQTEYRGRWANDMPAGSGTMTYSDGTQRKGIWQQGQLITSGDQSTSVGPVSYGQAPVLGCLRGDCQRGSGVYAFRDGSRYEGIFQDGLPNGQGTVFYANGERYEGLMYQGKLHGKGTLFYPDGRRITGVWEAGTYVQSMEAERAAPLSRPENVEQVKVWAVVIGVAAYSHMSVLRYTDDDAYRFYAFLKSPEGGAVADDQIRLLIDESATRNNILQAMREIFSRAGSRDLVILYFSGHGVPGAFLPIDYDGLHNKIFHEEINTLLNGSRAAYKLCIADACYSGGLLAARSGTATLMDYYRNLTKAEPGTALIMSSKSDETSLEASGLRHGVFSHFLIQGLKGEADANRDKVVTVQELFDFVYAQVRQYTGNVQSPVIFGDYDRNMVVGMRQSP